MSYGPQLIKKVKPHKSGFRPNMIRPNWAEIRTHDQILIQKPKFGRQSAMHVELRGLWHVKAVRLGGDWLVRVSVFKRCCLNKKTRLVINSTLDVTIKFGSCRDMYGIAWNCTFFARILPYITVIARVRGHLSLLICSAIFVTYCTLFCLDHYF